MAGASMPSRRRRRREQQRPRERRTGAMLRVICTIGVNPARRTRPSLTMPPNPSNSRNASFTFTGSDDTTALFDLEFQCRLDSTNELDWIECENPAEYFQPGSGRAYLRGSRRRSRPRRSIRRQRPTHGPTRHFRPMSRRTPSSSSDHRRGTPLFEAFFKFSSNEPDVTFECSIDGRLSSRAPTSRR